MLARWIRICWGFWKSASQAAIDFKRWIPKNSKKNIEKTHRPDFFLGFSYWVHPSIPEILSIPGPVASRDIQWHPLTPKQSQWYKPGKNEPRKAGLTAQMTRFMKPPQKVASSWPQSMADSDSPSTGLHTEKENPLLNKPRPSQAYVTSGTSGTPLK